MTRHGERGAVALEVVVLVPLVALLLGLFTASWRIGAARTLVADAANAGARAATLEATGAAARQRAERMVRANADLAGMSCDALDVTVDVSGFSRAPGQPAAVTVGVRCSVALHDLLLPGLPGHWSAAATSTQAMDTFRERRP